MLAIEGEITSGAVLACSILAGRVLNPILTLPALLVNQAHAKAAIKGLETLYRMETDNHGVDVPVAPERLRGQYELTRVSFSYPQKQAAIFVRHLKIEPGERVGVLGPIGAGKSTLLRVLAGMYRPQEGRALLDGLDIAQISRQLLSEQIGYLQQDHRLFQGTLRENLLIGMPDPGDEAMHDALTRTGLIKLVADHPRGLELPISEGGTGLSGGQRQLVAFTRHLLTRPPILLLDEPTASMDHAQEAKCIAVLSQELRNPARTLVLVTHKPSMLRLVDRLLIVAENQIVHDGPREQVLAHLARINNQDASAMAGVQGKAHMSAVSEILASAKAQASKPLV